MRKVLFILSLFLFSCSTNSDEPNQQEEISRPNFVVFLYETCDRNGEKEVVFTTEQEYDRIKEIILQSNNQCTFINATDYLGERYSGYYGGSKDPRE